MLINLTYNFNSIFVGAIPFLTEVPAKLPVRDNNLQDHITLMPTEEACKLHEEDNKDYTVIFDDMYNTSEHYHNPIT